MTISEHDRLIGKGSHWVAETSQNILVGFLAAEQFLDDLHIWELSVSLAWQRQGIGKKLIQRAIKHASASALRGVTLTTFADVPWNGPAYMKLGFKPLLPPGERMQAILDEEASRGMPAQRRLAMSLSIAEKVRCTPRAA